MLEITFANQSDVKLRHKLNSKTLFGPAIAFLMRLAGQQMNRDLQAFVPRATGASASKITSQTTDLMARVTAPAFPLQFLEFGTETDAGAPRIRPRKFMARVWARLRDALPNLIRQAETKVLEEWRR